MLETCAGRSIAHARNRGVAERHENESSLIEREHVVIYSHRARAPQSRESTFSSFRDHTIYFLRVRAPQKASVLHASRVLAPRKRGRNGWRSASERLRGTGAMCGGVFARSQTIFFSFACVVYVVVCVLGNGDRIQIARAEKPPVVPADTISKWHKHHREFRKKRGNAMGRKERLETKSGWVDRWEHRAKIGEEEKRDAIDNLLQKSSEKDEKNSEQRSKDEEKRLEDDTKAAIELFEKIPEKKKEEILRAMENFIAFDETEESKSWEKKESSGSGAAASRETKKTEGRKGWMKRR